MLTVSIIWETQVRFLNKQKPKAQPKWEEVSQYTRILTIFTAFLRIILVNDPESKKQISEIDRLSVMYGARNIAVQVVFGPITDEALVKVREKVSSIGYNLQTLWICAQIIESMNLSLEESASRMMQTYERLKQS